MSRNAHQLLDNIEAAAALAREAIADEHEGDLRRVVGILSHEATELRQLVWTW